MICLAICHSVHFQLFLVRESVVFQVCFWLWWCGDQWVSECMNIHFAMRHLSSFNLLHLPLHWTQCWFCRALSMCLVYSWTIFYWRSECRLVNIHHGDICASPLGLCQDDTRWYLSLMSLVQGLQPVLSVQKGSMLLSQVAPKCMYQPDTACYADLYWCFLAIAWSSAKCMFVQVDACLSKWLSLFPFPEATTCDKCELGKYVSEQGEPQLHDHHLLLLCLCHEVCAWMVCILAFRGCVLADQT